MPAEMCDKLLASNGVGGHNINPPGPEPLPQPSYLPCGRSSKRRTMVMPLSAIISFPSLEGQPYFNVDVLDVSEGGLRLQLALPSDLTLEPGQEGVISLVIRRSEAPHMYPFTVPWVEMNALISVAGVSFVEPVDLAGLPEGQTEVLLPQVEVSEPTR